MSDSVIYAVDDEAAVLSVIGGVLRDAGFRVETFTNPATALAALATAEPKPALLIADLRLPGMHGVEFISRCKDMLPTLKTICCTGEVQSTALEVRILCADLVLWKPFDPGRLRSAVAGVLAGDGSPQPRSVSTGSRA